MAVRLAADHPLESKVLPTFDFCLGVAGTTGRLTGGAAVAAGGAAVTAGAFVAGFVSGLDFFFAGRAFGRCSAGSAATRESDGETSVARLAFSCAVAGAVPSGRGGGVGGAVRAQHSGRRERGDEHHGGERSEDRGERAIVHVRLPPDSLSRDFGY